MSFSAIPIRLNGQDVLSSWFNALRTAGINVENFLGPGYVAETKQALVNGQASPLTITGFAFDSTLYSSVKMDVEINQKTATSELIWQGTVRMFWRALTSSWDVAWDGQGDEPGITFSVVTTSTTGQLKYILDTLAGSSYVGSIKLKAITFGV